MSGRLLEGVLALVLSLLAALAPLGVTARAWAQATEDERLQEAIRLSELGRLHYDGGEFAEAAEAFARAWDLHPDPVLGYNAARSFENAGEPEQALSYYRATLDLGSGDEELRQRCREGVARIENLLARVEAERQSEPAVVQAESEPPGAEVWVGDDALGVTPTDVSLPPGEYVVTLRLEGFVDTVEDVVLTPGQVFALRVNLVPEVARQPPAEDRGGPNWLAVGLTAGTGGALLGLGALSAIGAQQKYDEAQTPEIQRDGAVFGDTVQRGRELRNASHFFYGLGAATVVVAVVLFFVTEDRGDERADRARIDVGPTVGGAAAGVSIPW